MPKEPHVLRYERVDPEVGGSGGGGGSRDVATHASSAGEVTVVFKTAGGVREERVLYSSGDSVVPAKKKGYRNILSKVHQRRIRKLVIDLASDVPSATPFRYPETQPAAKKPKTAAMLAEEFDAAVEKAIPNYQERLRAMHERLDAILGEK